MNDLNALNLHLFLDLNGSLSIPAWLLVVSFFLANQLIYLIPVGLAGTWFWGNRRSRALTLKILLTILAALAINHFIGYAWPTDRPFVIGVGHTRFLHKPTPSFPSNHAAIIWASGLTLLYHGPHRPWGWLIMASGAAVAWSRVFLGVHFPLDMVGALATASIATVSAQIIWKWIETPVVRTSLDLYHLVFAYPIAWKWIRN